VTNEKQRLTQKRQTLVKSEMDKRMAELVKFSQSFKVSACLSITIASSPRLTRKQLNRPIPDDLVSILAKDEDKQKAIKEKSEKDAEPSTARTIGVAPSVTSTPAARAAPLIPAIPLKPETIRKHSVITEKQPPLVLSKRRV